VLPLPTHIATHQVRRARRQVELGDAALAARPTLEAHPARGEDRDARDRLEDRGVAMPPDAGASRVARDEHLDEVLRVPFHQPGTVIAQPEHLLWEWIGWGELPPLIGVREPEVTHAASSGPPAHDDRSEVQRVEQM